MNKFAKAVTGILTGTILTVTAGAGFIYTQRDALIQKVAAKAADIASDALGTKVEIGDIIIGNLDTESMSDITVKDLALYDKNSELIAKAESAEVNFKLLDLYNDPLTAINEINVKNVEGNIVKRDNATWNFNDIKTSSGGESNFDADINIENAKINAKFDDNELIADVENAALDFDSTAKFTAELNVNSVEGDITALINSGDDSADDSNSAVEVYDSDFGSYSNELTKVLAATASSTAEDTFSLNNLNLKLDFDHTNIKVEADVQNVNADINDNEIEASNLKAKVDYDNADDKQNIEAEVSARAFDSTNINATANITDNKQVVNADVNFLDVKNVLPFIPDDIMPAGVEVTGGVVNDAKIKLIKRGDDVTFDGSAKIYNGGVKVEQIDIENINGTVSFNNSEVLVDAAMSANGQQAEVEGSIHIDTDEPYFDINAKSDSFNPNAIMYLPTEGAASFNAHLTGTVSNPIVDAYIYSPSVVYEDLSFSNISTHMKYAEDVVYLSDFKTNIFGGTARGDIEFKAQDLSYNAHIKADSINVNRLKNYLPALANVSGSISADVGINGLSDDLDKLKIYGSATTYNVNYDNIAINRADASFYVEGDDVKIDYLSASLPNKGSIGAEGTITDGDNLDLKFYGGHVDMSVIENFIPQVDVSGLADFQGQINGHVDNPDINLQLSAVDNSKREGDNFKGVLFDQPYDSIVLTASGSLDGVEISKFNMIRDGKDVWIAKGKVGLTGEKNLDIRVDTVGARAETLIALVAPDQELTGNVDNVITVTGTLDNPHLTGYVHFWRGSYRGILVNGMDGDYFIEGDKIRLQDFHINSPMIDMDLNGVIDRVTTDMDFTVEAYDVNMRRFEGKLPENYPASGHGSFSGVIKGNMDHPIFDGKLAAKELSFNGVSITDVDGKINVNGNDIHLDNFSFNQGDGSYKVRGNINYVTGVMNGNSEVTNVDIPELFALANLKNELVTGKLNSKMEFGGTMQNPSLYMVGNISKGTFAGSDIHDINLEFNLLNNTVYINKLEGFQGETGALSVEGKASLIGPLDMTLSAHNLELAMFVKAAGLEAEVVGTTNIEANIGGTSVNPDVEMEIVAHGGIKGSTFDLMRGNLELKDGIVNVDNFIVQRAIADKMYQVSAKGLVPLISLITDKASKLKSQEQINLDISLDGADLSLLPVISDYVAWALGEMQGNLKITGTASDPRINGTISVAEGSTKIKNMSSLIEHMNMTLAFIGNKITVEEFTGNIGSGKYNLTGGLDFDGLDPTDYNFNFTADKLMIKSSFFRGPLTMEFSLNEAETRFGKFPKLAGHIDFDNCLISVPTIPESEGESPNILLDIAVNLGDKVHFYTPYLYDMYLTGQAKFEGSTTHPKPSGSFYVKRGGTINYLKTVFNIREGEAHFNQPDTFFPTIRFNADTRLTKTRIYLNIDGSLKDRSLRLTSSPEMSETEIMQLLTLRDAYQKGGDTEIEAGDLINIGLQMSFLSEVESAVRKTFGFDQFAISRGSGSAFDNKTELRDRSEEEYNVAMGKYITDNVMLKYTRGIGGDNINRYGVQYDFNEKMGVTAEREGHDFIVGFEARWKF